MSISKFQSGALGTAGILSLALVAADAANAQNNKSDGSWTSLSGTVVSQTNDRFTLDYGEGKVTIEVDDWDEFQEGTAVKDGDKVTVYGEVDKDFYRKRTIEADSIYVEDLNTVLTGPEETDEEEYLPPYFTYYSVPLDYDFQVTGTVTSTDGREFKIDTGDRSIQVDTMLMSYNPMDEHGYQKVEKGDFVTVSGDLDSSIFESREIVAETIVSLN